MTPSISLAVCSANAAGVDTRASGNAVSAPRRSRRTRPSTSTSSAGAATSRERRRERGLGDHDLARAEHVERGARRDAADRQARSRPRRVTLKREPVSSPCSVAKSRRTIAPSPRNVRSAASPPRPARRPDAGQLRRVGAADARPCRRPRPSSTRSRSRPWRPAPWPPHGPRRRPPATSRRCPRRPGRAARPSRAPRAASFRPARAPSRR